MNERVYLEHLQQSARKLDAVVKLNYWGDRRGDFTLPKDMDSRQSNPN